MDACLLVVTKSSRDIPKDDEITILFEYGIFKTFLVFSSWKAREHDSLGEWCFCILWHGPNMSLNARWLRLFLEGVRREYNPGAGCTVPADICSVPRDLITTTAPPWSRRNLCNLASATAPLSAESSSRTPFLWAVLRKKDFLSSETFN